MSIEKTLNEILLDILEIEENDIVPEASITGELGASSVDVVEIVAALESELDIDIPDEDLEKKREERKKRGLLEKLGLRKPKKEEPPKQNVELNEYIRTESPYVVWVNPFDFGIDPTVTSPYDARYVYQKVTKLLDEVKSNPNYKNTVNLKGTDIKEGLTKDIPETQLDHFKTVQLYEIHYKTDQLPGVIF